MASVQYSGIGITDMAGSVGGTTFQRNASGAFSRDKPNPTQPGTEYQLTQQARFTEVSQHWATLSQSQMDAWISFAATSAGEYQNRLGITCHYTGQQLFVKLNLSAYTTSFPINDPPAVPSIATIPPELLTTQVTGASFFSMNLKFESTLADPAYTLKIYATPPLSPGVNRPRKSLFAEISVMSGDQGDATITIMEAYEKRYGVPTVGAKIFVKAVFVDNSSGFDAVAGIVMGKVVELV